MIGLWLLACTGEPAPVAEVPVTIAPVAAPDVVLPDVVLAKPSQRHATPVVMALSPRDEAARLRLETLIRGEALDATNPWAVKHAMLALGVDIALPDGRPAVDALFADHAVEFPIAGHTYVDFPEKGSGEDVRIEPHTDLMLKAFVDGGVDPARIVTVQGHEHPLSDLYWASLARTWVDGDRLWTTSYNDTPWALQGLTGWAPGKISWTAQGGHAMTLDKLTHAVVADLDHQTQFLAEAKANGTRVEKKKQGIFAYTCGGAHLLQGAAYAVARGYGESTDRGSIEAQVPLLFFRYDIEMRTVDDALAAYPEYALPLLGQRLKWLGHFLETAEELAALGFYVPDADQQRILAAAVVALTETVERLDKVGAIDRIRDLKPGETHQLYLDLIGDACHAVHGLDLATGARSVVD